MAKEKRSCNNCNCWEFEEIDKGHICCNPQSSHCADWTEKDDCCDCWIKKEKKK